MIDIGKILKRAWQILWSYRVLWIFAILLVLFGGSSGAGNSGFSYQFNRNNYNGNNGNNPYYGPLLRQPNDWVIQNINPLFDNFNEHIGTWIWIGVGFVLFILVMIAITALIRYPAETAVYRMVDEYEQSGTKMKFSQGWKLGWNRRAFRIWVIDLVLGLPAFLFILMLIGLGVGIYYSVASGSVPGGVVGVVVGSGLTVLLVLAFILGMTFLGLLRQFFVRTAALENAGIGDSFQRGWTLFKANWKSALLIWLVMLGLGIGFGIAGIILFFLLIPVFILLILPGLLVAAIPGLLVFGIASIFAHPILAGILGALVALPFFFTVMFAPLTLVNAWYLLFVSNVWTLTYREMKAMENLPPAKELPPMAS
jgi:hypothetical protein